MATALGGSNAAFHVTAAANLGPELEKPGLLPQRPTLGSTYECGASTGQQDNDSGWRRPADVYLPRWRSGPPAALDFAITSGLKPDSLADAVHNRDRICAKYEDIKCSFKDTKAQCLSQGFSFLPMIMEATGGGWGKTARCFWSMLAKTSCLASGELATESICAVHLQQRLSMILHREKARASLRRL